MDEYDQHSTLSRWYLQRVRLPYLEQILYSNSPTLNESWQEFFLSQTVEHPLSRRFPPARAYRRSLLKRVINKIEKNVETEVSESLMEAYGDIMMETGDKEFGYKTCLLPRNNYASVLESELLISNGTTGLQTWSSSMRLAEYLVQHCGILKEKKVLELGSGLGLMGLILSTHCHPRKFTFTDFHESVLTTLNNNITLHHNVCTNTSCQQLNLNSYSGDVITSCHDVIDCSHKSDVTENDNDVTSIRHWSEWTCNNCEEVSCEKERKVIEWSSLDKYDVSNLDYDIIVMADVVYDIDLVPYLLKSLRLLHEVRPASITYMGATIRHPATLHAFLDGLDRNGLSYEELELPAEHLFHVGDHSHKLHKIITKSGQRLSPS